MDTLHIIIIFIYEIIMVLTVVHVLMENKQPSETMAWALVVYFIPVIGIVFYLFFGMNDRKERKIERKMCHRVLTTKEEEREIIHEAPILDSRQNLIAKLFENHGSAPPCIGNNVEIFTSGQAFFAELIHNIKQARYYIHIEMFILEDDSAGNLVADALMDVAKQGVKVHLIYDDVGCWKVKRKFFKRLNAEGIETIAFLPVHFPMFTRKANYRNHRKIIVIDGWICYIGGMNLALRYVKGDKKRAWRDTMIKIKGSATEVVDRVFSTDWFRVSGAPLMQKRYIVKPKIESNTCPLQVVTSSPIAPYPTILQGYLRIIASAKHYVYIQTPYFLPPEAIITALETAALGGVDIRMMVPMRTDSRIIEWASRAYMRRVVKAGVKILLYNKGFLHSKMLVSDDDIATCGSTNIDSRSFEKDFEANVFFYGKDISLKFKEMFLEDLKHTTMLEDIQKRIYPTFLTRLWEGVVRLLAPLL